MSTRKKRHNPRRRTSKRTVKKVEKRVSAALSRFLKKQNPAFKKAAGVRVQKLKGGVIKLTPVRTNPVVRVKIGGNLDAAVRRAQKLADRTKQSVEVHYQERSREGRGDKNYWAYYTTIRPRS